MAFLKENDGGYTSDHEKEEFVKEQQATIKTDIKDYIIDQLFNLKTEMFELVTDGTNGDKTLEENIRCLTIKDFKDFIFNRGYVDLKDHTEDTTNLDYNDLNNLLRDNAMTKAIRHRRR